jgi:hypothetical protein
MNSQLTDDFLACFARLPEAVKAQARKAYRLWRENPSHASSSRMRLQARESVPGGRHRCGRASGGGSPRAPLRYRRRALSGVDDVQKAAGDAAVRAFLDDTRP